MLKNCPQQKSKGNNIHNIREDTIVHNVARTIPKIYVALEDHQADHQLAMIAVEGKISKQYLSILIEIN